MKKAILKRIDWPDFGEVKPPSPPEAGELLARLSCCRQKMEERGLSHLVIYADREHFANMFWLTNFDPRFEEALMILGTDSSRPPLVLVGNECESHLNMSPLLASGDIRCERYQPFSLLDQPRDESRPLMEIFSDEGVGRNSEVGCVGWKYFSEKEFERHGTVIEIPAYIVDILRKMAGSVSNATDLFMSPESGMRTICSPYEIALFEYSNSLSATGIRNGLENFKPGITDTETVRYYQYNGMPLSCHIGMKSSGNQHYGLSSPTGDVIRLGQPASTGIAYRGSNVCRAGWVAESEADLPENAKDYAENFAGPYFCACAEWLEHLKIGTTGHELWKIINDLLPYDKFGIYLNPGHLIHYDEWLSSPIYKGSEISLKSGMCIQTDIIPRSPIYSSSRMEDGLVLADNALQDRLQEFYPDVHDRCTARRDFVRTVIGINLPDEVLPLSDTFGIVPPYFLDYRKIFTLK